MELAIAEEPIEVRYRDHTTYCEETMPPTCNDYGIVRTVCCDFGAPQMKRQRGGGGKCVRTWKLAYKKKRRKH